MTSVTLDQVVAKERQLEVLRHELQVRSQRADAALARVMPNFPPKFLCIRPIVYHDITAEVIPERQRFAKAAFASYIALCVLILLNIIVALIGFATPNKASSTSGSAWGTHFGVSFLYLLGIPGAFMVWYFQIYTAITGGDPGKYTLASFGMFLGFCFDVFLAIGILKFGGCGWLYIVAAQTDKTNVVTTAVAIVTSASWSVHAVVFIWLWSRFRGYSAIDQVRALGMDVVPAGAAAPASRHAI